MTKPCTKCGEEKPLSAFYERASSRDGYHQQCKECLRAGMKRNYEANRRARIQGARTWAQQHPEKIREYRQRREKRHRQKVRARGALNDALAQGRITKPRRCEGCGRFVARRRLEGHHSNYLKPLDVEWLCKTCHQERHKEESND